MDPSASRAKQHGFLRNRYRADAFTGAPSIRRPFLRFVTVCPSSGISCRTDSSARPDQISEPVMTIPGNRARSSAITGSLSATLVRSSSR
jgi:hypothetical protein